MSSSNYAGEVLHVTDKIVCKGETAFGVIDEIDASGPIVKYSVYYDHEDATYTLDGSDIWMYVCEHNVQPRLPNNPLGGLPVQPMDNKSEQATAVTTTTPPPPQSDEVKPGMLVICPEASRRAKLPQGRLWVVLAFRKNSGQSVVNIYPLNGDPKYQYKWSAVLTSRCTVVKMRSLVKG